MAAQFGKMQNAAAGAQPKSCLGGALICLAHCCARGSAVALQPAIKSSSRYTAHRLYNKITHAVQPRKVSSQEGQEGGQLPLLGRPAHGNVVSEARAAAEGLVPWAHP